MGSALMVDNEVNSNGLTQTNPPKDTRVPVLKYLIVDINGQGDDVHYTTHLEAYNSVCDCDDVIDYARKVFHEEKWKIVEPELSDWISENIKEIADELGYRLIPVADWRKS
jgi:hypothetical protein